MTATDPAAESIRGHALALAEDGIPVLPCRPDKAPYTAHGLHDAATDAETIRDWWDRYPDALVAVPTGAASGLMVLDIDPDGAQWYADHADRLAAGRVHRTRRGHHLLYRAPGTEIRNSAGRIAPGVDVRAEGGYTIWWPAHGMTATGDMADITDPPGWLVEALTTPPRETPREPISGDIIAGGRNDYLSREGYRLRRQGASTEQVYRVIAAMNDTRCRPPLADDEVRAIARGKARVPADDDEATDRPRFRLVRAGDMEPRAPEWMIRGYVERDALALIFGDPECGKSFVAVDMACCIATGIDWHGRRVQQSPVIYIAGEGQSGMGRRKEAWSIRHGIDLSDAPLWFSTAAAAMTDADALAEVEDAIDTATGDTAPGVVVLDTLARNFGGGDENSTQDMTAFIDAADRIRVRYGCTVLIVHHTGHADKSRARGAMALKGALDAEYRIDRDETGVVRMAAAKMKDGPYPEPMAFQLRPVELGVYDEDGEPVTSAVPDPTSYEPPPAAGKAGRGKWQTLALQVLADMHRDRRGNLETGGHDPDGARVSVEEWRTECMRQGLPRKKFYAVRSALAEQNRVTIQHGYVS